MKRKTTLLVMAAGMGSRFGSLKQITPLGPHQKALLHYTIYDAVHAGFDKIVFVIRESFAKEFIDFVGKYAEGLVETAYCYQSMDKLPGGMPPIEREKPWGTAHAIWSAKEVIDEPFAALNADDFYGSDAFVKAHTISWPTKQRTKSSAWSVTVWLLPYRKTALFHEGSVKPTAITT